MQGLITSLPCRSKIQRKVRIRPSNSLIKFYFKIIFFIKETEEPEEIEENEEERKEKEAKSRTSKISLDRYCVKYTSEDNESFQHLHKFTEDKKKEQYAYLHAFQAEGDRRCDPTADNRLKGLLCSRYFFGF